MKITRPPAILLFSRRLCFSAGGFNMWEASRDKLERTRVECAHIGGPTGLCNMTKVDAILSNTTYSVSGDLSRDMESSTFSGEMKLEHFPSASGIINWLDETLPQVAYSLVPIKGTMEPGVVFVVDAKENWGTYQTQSHCYSFPLSRWEKLLDGTAVVGNLSGMFPELDHALSDAETEGLLYLVRLVAKVLTFAAIDRTRVETLSCVSRSDRKAAGIHPKHDNGVKMSLIRYLPRVHTERAAQHLEYIRETEKAGRRFLGRVGHVRYYQHERYVNMRGKTTYIWPIPAPEGYKIEYRIVIPNANFDKPCSTI